MAKRKTSNPAPAANNYQHPESDLPLRPDIGTQARFQKRKLPATYRFDSSLAPELQWDGQNAARELGESQLSVVSGQLKELQKLLATNDGQLATDQRGQIEQRITESEDVLCKLVAMSRPFLNWSGKAERQSFDVPTLPLFVHERLSTKAIIETLQGHRRSKEMQLELFADPQHSIADQVLRAYEHRDRWTNRIILGDSLVVMNSLVHYESLGGAVQMIYMDPPYGVKFGSNFQPFVRRRDVKHNDDEDLTREPEMVQAYRDTWELGLHSYLTYLRDRLLVARELLAPSGSLFVQISDENLHHVREVMDEVFGAENFVSQISFKKTGGLDTSKLSTVCDFIVRYAKDIERLKYRPLYLHRRDTQAGLEAFKYLFDDNGKVKTVSFDESGNPVGLPAGSDLFQSMALTSQGISANSGYVFKFKGREYRCPGNKHWRFAIDGLNRLSELNRIIAVGDNLRAVSYLKDFPFAYLNNVWTDTGAGSFLEAQAYVVQTTPKVVQRCLLMTTDPGDLVVDPTCGGGTTAYVAEQWGRRWITIDVSRVPLALARQRLLTATFPWYQLADEPRGPAGGFTYRRKQNSKGEEVGGIVPHVTLKSIANNEPPAEEVLVDRPETTRNITRVTGPFTFEATIPTPIEMEEGESGSGGEGEEPAQFVDRMLEVLRKSPVLRLDGNKTVTFKNVRTPAKTLSLSAEALVVPPSGGPAGAEPQADPKKPPEGGTTNGGQPVAFVFGPENGAVSEKLVHEALREAHLKSYTHLYVIGFAIQPNARSLIESSAQIGTLPATYVQATPDLLMGDLLKNMRSSQIFSVCGLPEIQLIKLKSKGKNGKSKDGNGEPRFQVKLLGLDVFDPITMEVEHKPGNDVPAWLLDTDYNELSFHVCQAFFPRTAAWDNLKKALKGTYDETVWDHLAGDTSALFPAGEHGQIAVKVIDDRGNELLVVKRLEEPQ